MCLGVPEREKERERESQREGGGGGEGGRERARRGGERVDEGQGGRAYSIEEVTEQVPTNTNISLLTIFKTPVARAIRVRRIVFLPKFFESASVRHRDGWR